GANPQGDGGAGCGPPLRPSPIAEPPAVMGAQKDGRTVTAMALDLILRNARLASTGPEQPTVDIGVQHGRIVAIEPRLTAEGPAYDAGGELVSPGLIESPFHLDQARLIERVPPQPNPMVRHHMERDAATTQAFTPDQRSTP